MAALHRKGAFLYLPPKAIVEAPIQILHVMDHDDQLQMLMPRLQVFVGTHSDSRLISTQQNLGDNRLFCQSSRQSLCWTKERMSIIHKCCAMSIRKLGILML